MCNLLIAICDWFKGKTPQQTEEDIQRSADLTKGLTAVVVEYMMTHHNVSWLDDNIERELYADVFKMVERILIPMMQRDTQ